MRDPLLNKVGDHDSYFLFRSAVPLETNAEQTIVDLRFAFSADVVCTLNVGQN